MKKIEESEKRKKNKKGKKRKGVDDDYCDNFKIDVNDERFSALYTSHHFNIDPADPQFKATKATNELIKEKLKRRDMEVHNFIFFFIFFYRLIIYTISISVFFFRIMTYILREKK